MARKLQNRLALAQFKAKHGWEDLTLDLIEPKVEEHLRRQRPSSAGDILSDSSSSTASDFQYPRALLSSSPLKAPIFSDAVNSSSSSTGHRKRTYNASFQHPSSTGGSRKRFRSSPPVSRSLSYSHTSWKDQHHLAQSSPIKPRKASHFTTTANPNLSFYRGTGTIFEEPLNSATFSQSTTSDDDDDLLPMHSFKMPSQDIRSSPPRTPPPMRGRASLGRRHPNGKTTNGKSEEGADLLLYLATSPSPANPSARSRLHPPQTPPSRNPALPSSMMTTPNGGSGLLAAFGIGGSSGGGPVTPSQAFDFADFVNITPSPAQNAWSKTPRTVRTPATVARRNAAFEAFAMGQSPRDGLRRQQFSPGGRLGAGLGLGGDLLS
jgi:hypothetical protein